MLVLGALCWVQGAGCWLRGGCVTVAVYPKVLVVVGRQAWVTGRGEGAGGGQAGRHG